MKNPYEMNTEECLFIIHPMHPKWFIDVHVKGKAIEFLDYSIEEYLHDLEISFLF